jgi:hypothetical protein
MSPVECCLKLVLWLQLLLRGMWGDFLRYYGALIFWSAALLAGTWGELLCYPPPASLSYLNRRMLTTLCVLALVAGYLLGRALGKGVLIVMGSLIAGVFIITPATILCIQARGEDAPDLNIATDDSFMFFKGAAFCALLFLLMAGGLGFLRERARHASRRVLPRSFIVRVLIVATPILLELIRLSARLALPVHMPWEGAAARFFSEPGWPYALALTAWLSIVYLWVDYDSRILPHLMRRAGVDWEGDRLGLNDAYLVDQLLQARPQTAPMPRSAAS